MQPKPQPEALRDDIAVIEDDVDESARTAVRPIRATWKVLVVDDDPEVHAVTRFVLGKTEMLGRPLELIEANSSREGQAQLLQHSDIAVVLLDVVMEEHDSGLKFARWVREAGLQDVRIVLRTGQPGYAPELDVIRDYDINDYRAKSELTQTRLITSMTAALRSYQQIETIERSRRGLEMIISSCSQLFQKRELADFSHGVLMQIASLCGVSGDSVICASMSGSPPEKAKIVSGVGEFAKFIGKDLGELPDIPLAQWSLASMTRGASSTEGPLILSVDAPPDRRLVAAFDREESLDSMDSALLGVFAANIAVGFENVGLIERLDRLAYWDETVDLPSRNRLLKDISESDPASMRVALIRVVSYSDTLVAFGQVIATGLLREIASHLASARGGGKVYRYAEDVLAVILAADSHQETLLSSLGARSFSVSGQSVRARFAIGWAALTSNDEPAAFCDRAYAAMALAAMSGQGEPAKFEPAIIQDARFRIEMMADLREALERDALDIAFQPIVELSSGRCTGVEALCRWNRNSKPISPADFIPLAEQSGLSLAIFDLGVRRAADLLRSSRLDYVSVNLSACDLQRTDLSTHVIHLLGNAGLPPAALQIEITEQSLIRDFNISEQNLRALKNLGCRVAIDDFGTGYSSLSYIGRLPIDVLKIDRQFVTDITTNASSQAIVGLTVELARRLGLQVLAEGIEKEEQRSALAAMGLNYGQGYKYGQAMDATVLGDWLANQK